jgi:AraC family transcriptional regulator, transcriptional activator of pobA
MKAMSLGEFYKEVPPLEGTGPSAELMQQFHVFDQLELARRKRNGNGMEYKRRVYYKISLIIGRNRVEYADKVIDVEERALLFATPKVPYRFTPLNDDQAGHFCIFTHEFLFRNGRGATLDDLPILKPGAFPLLQVTKDAALEITGIFEKMHREIGSDYSFKEDLLRNYVMELIHYGQKLQPMATIPAAHTAADRISDLFMELLDRQFPIEKKDRSLELRTPAEFADRLSIHVSHLNKALNGTLGRTTSDVINARVVQEAKILLKQKDWNISEIAFALGFQEVSHFSNFFRKHTTTSPSEFRS